jgi:CRISPR system Cascade subunit CasC
MKTIQVHSLFSLPVHVPNRGADGLAKRAVFGGIERQRISYQAQQYALRHSPLLSALETAAGIGHSHRTALVGDRLLRPALETAGVADAEGWADAVMALWRKEKAEKAAGDDEVNQPLIVGEQEVRLFVAVVQACVAAGIEPDALRALVEKKMPKDTASGVVAAIDALKTASGSVGLDGALFGRMATGVAVANVNRAVRIGDALTTHAITPVVDFFLVTDDLKDRAAGEAGGSHINTREEAAGLFYRHVLIDTAQLKSNGVEPESVIEPLVTALLTVSPIGDRSPARVVETLVEIGAQVRSLMDAYATPEARQDKAVARLRESAKADYDLYGVPAAALWLSEQQTPRVPSLAAAALAAWRA